MPILSLRPCVIHDKQHAPTLTRHRPQITQPRPKPSQLTVVVLGVIQDYCLREKLPPLTILVVNRRGFPSEGFIAWDVDDLDEGYRLVYGYPWHELANPFGFAASGTTLEQLAQRLLTMPDESAEVYGRIQNRGMAQVLFRQTLLAAYGWRCAFCGLSLGAALQAAHIIPWRKATVAQRLDPRNGLLLCATHHALLMPTS